MRAHASIVLVLLLLLAGCQKGEQEIRFGGGPAGGTFQRFALGMAATLEEGLADTRVSVQRSGGSLANLVDVDQGKLDMGLVYAGDAYLGRRERLERKLPPTERVRALTRLYGASAHLVVRRDSPCRSPLDLRGKRVAIGSPGSGAALAAERFFRALGIWDAIIPVSYGYDLAMKDLIGGAVTAVWELVGLPSPSLREMSGRIPLRLLDLQDPARRSGLFEAYPFYTAAAIPAGTYDGQERDVETFQDATLWVAAAGMDEERVYRGLRHLFSDGGLARMRRVHPAARDLRAETGLLGVEIPLHPGAERFWRERGMWP